MFLSNYSCQTANTAYGFKVHLCYIFILMIAGNLRKQAVPSKSNVKTSKNKRSQQQMPLGRSSNPQPDFEQEYSTFWYLKGVFFSCGEDKLIRKTALCCFFLTIRNLKPKRKLFFESRNHAGGMLLPFSVLQFCGSCFNIL